MLHHLLMDAYSRPIPSSKTRRPVRALILAPTRELALQVSSHLNACLSSVDVDVVKTDDDATTFTSPKGKNKGKGKGKAKAAEVPAEGKPKHPPLVSVAAIVGGMSAHKQRRIISRGVDVLVATPGRLWDTLQEVCHGIRTLENDRALNRAATGRRVGDPD